MKLNLILPTRTLNLNNKEIKIPKLGLKHHKLLKDPKSVDESMRILVDDIHPGLDGAEAEYVIVYLAAFNGRCKEQVTKDGFTYDITTMRIVRETKFEFEKEYEFRSPYFGEVFLSAKHILTATHPDVDWGQMPAFVAKWAEKITATIEIDGPNGPISGCADILKVLA